MDMILIDVVVQVCVCLKGACMWNSAYKKCCVVLCMTIPSVLTDLSLEFRQN